MEISSFLLLTPKTWKSSLVSPSLRPQKHGCAGCALHEGGAAIHTAGIMGLCTESNNCPAAINSNKYIIAIFWEMEGKYDYRPQGPFPPSTLNYFHGFLASTPVLIQPFSAQRSARPCKSGQVSSWLETLQWSFTQRRCSQVLYELCPITLCHPWLPLTLCHARVLTLPICPLCPLYSCFLPYHSLFPIHSTDPFPVCLPGPPYLKSQHSPAPSPILLYFQW